MRMRRGCGFEGVANGPLVVWLDNRGAYLNVASSPGPLGEANLNAADCLHPRLKAI